MTSTLTENDGINLIVGEFNEMDENAANALETLNTDQISINNITDWC